MTAYSVHVLFYCVFRKSSCQITYIAKCHAYMYANRYIQKCTDTNLWQLFWKINYSQISCILDILYRVFCVLQVLTYFHQQKKKSGVDAMLLNLYEPFLWRSLKVCMQPWRIEQSLYTSVNISYTKTIAWYTHIHTTS